MLPPFPSGPDDRRRHAYSGPVLPLALIVTTGAELHRPLAVVYIGGFFFAILLRLIVVPVMYEFLGASEEKRKRRQARSTDKPFLAE